MGKLIFFTSSKRKGSRFIQVIERLFLKLNLDNEIVFIEKDVNPLQQQQFLYAVHIADIVVVDCTILNDNSDGGVYPALTAQINILNHVIVISENNLPLNITPYRGVYPKGDGQTFTLDYIVQKLPSIIECSLKEDTYHRLPEDFYQDFMKYQVEMEEMMASSLNGRRLHKTKKTPVMISYRNSHIREVEEFKTIVLSEDFNSAIKRKEMGCEGEYEIKILPPASLCGEFEAHTPMRRWMLVGLLEDYIRKVDEVWVYESRKDGRIDYTDSWWTIAEMVIVANINFNSNKQIKIRVFNSQEYKFYKTTPEKYLVKLSVEQHKKLARFLSNTRPDTMGPECLEQVGQLKVIAEFMRTSTKELKQQMLESLRANFEQSVPKTLSQENRENMITDLVDMYSNPEKIEAYINDDVFNIDFWEKISFQTQLTTDCFESDKINVDKFMSIPMDEKTSLSLIDFEKASNSDDGLINLGTWNDRKNYKVTKSSTDRYLWLATRMGQPTIKGDNAPGLERIHIYNLLKV